MRTHTSDYKNEIKRLGREIDSKITYGITELGKEQLNSVTPHYESSLLKSVMKQLDIDSNVEIPLETVVNYQFGVKVGNSYEYLNYGNYVVYNVEKQEDTKSWKITCYDKMLYAMKDYESLGITYPITVKNFLVAICTKLGLTLANDDFVNANKEILSELYLDSEGNSLGYTYRDVLDEIAQVVAGIICINDDDELEVRYQSNAGTYETVEETNLHLDNVDDTDDFSYELNGNTVQDDTPSPESFVEVQTVTGRQEINICEKNLFNLNGTYYKRSTNNIISINENDITVQNNASNSLGFIWWNIPVDVSKQVSISYGDMVETTTHTNNRIIYTFVDTPLNAYDNTILTNATDLSKNSKKVTITPSGRYLVLCLKLKSGGSDYSYTISNIQVEYGTPTTYEEYNGQSYEINLGKNLFDKINATYKNGYIKDENGNETTTNTSSYTTSYVSVLPNTTYTLSGSIASSSAGGRVYYYDANKDWISRSAGFGPTVNVATFTTPANCYYLQVQYVTSVFNEDTLQIERGDTKTNYASYKTPIELCKIQDYKDKIYNQNNKWYLEKNIGKVIFNGTENWADRPNYTYADRFVLSNGVPNQKTNNFNGYSNYFEVANGGTIPDTYPYIRPNNTQATCNFSAKGTTTLAQFKTWLSTHNTILYYILATPTTTEITDTELINQLEAIRLQLGVNNITVDSNNLSSPLKLTYLSELETIDEEMLKNVNVNFGEKFGPVNSVVLSRSAESDNIYRKDETSITQNGLTEIKIKENQILNGNNRDEFIDGIFDQLKGLEYYVNDYVSTGIAYLELGDIYKVKVEDNYYKCLMLNDELDVTQGLEEPIHAERMENSETDYKHASKTDRTINRAYIIVKKNEAEIEALASKVVDISDTTNGIGSIQLSNAYKGILHRLEISGSINAILPNTSLTPKNDLLPIGIYIVVDETRYLLDINYLIYNSAEEHDTFVYEDGNCWIERINGTIEDREPVEILVEKNSQISIVPFNEAHLFCEYLLDNKYTSTFANQVEVTSELNLLADTLEAKVSQVADNDGNVTSASIILAVNNDSSQAQINADKISLEGKEINLTSDDINIKSNNFNVDKNGTMTCNNANINNGIIKTIAENNDIVTIGGMQGIIIQDGDVLPFGIEQYSILDGNGMFIYNNDNSFPKASYDTNEMFFQPYPNYLSIKMDGNTGNITCVSLTQTSEEDKKKNFEKLQNALDIINNIDIYKYNYKHEQDNSKKHIGLVIGKNYKYSKEVTSENNDSVDIYSFVSVCCKAIQELQQEIEELRKEIK